MMPIVPKTDPKIDIKRLFQQGAILLDIRTEEEYVGFHLSGALNIPLDDLDANLDCIQSWQKAVIVYGADDLRSSKAVNKLKHRGIFAVDGGSREELQSRLK